MGEKAFRVRGGGGALRGSTVWGEHLTVGKHVASVLNLIGRGKEKKRGASKGREKED